PAAARRRLGTAAKYVRGIGTLDPWSGCCAVPARHCISGRPEPRLRHPSDQARVNNDQWATDHGQRGMLGISLVDKRRRGGGAGIVAGGQGGSGGGMLPNRDNGPTSAGISWRARVFPRDLSSRWWV